MATVVRAEAVITAQNRLRPGLTSAVRDLEKFKRSAAQAARQTQMMEKAGTALRVAGGIAGGALVAAGALQAVRRVTERYADLDRQMTRIGITGDASKEEVAAGLVVMRDLAQEVAAPVDQIKAGMDALTSSGLSFKEALAVLPSVARTAQASGAAFDDIANSSLAAMRHLKIQAKDLQLAQDMMAFGGQMGQFELKDMARYLPSLAPAAKAVGFEGTKGLARMVAMLQVVREGAGTSEEAATNFANILQKMESEETVNKFEKMGVDLRKEMDRARKSGDDLFETFVKASQVALKGDMSKLPQLFADAQMQKGMRALLDGYGKIPDMVSKLGGAAGTVQGNLKRIAEDTKSSFDRLYEAGDRYVTVLGRIASIGASPAMSRTASILDGMASTMERMVNVGVKPVLQEFTDRQVEAVASHVDETRMAGVRERARRAAEPDAVVSALDSEIESLRARPQIPAVRNRIDQLQARRNAMQVTREQQVVPLTDMETQALSRQQARLRDARDPKANPDYTKLPLTTPQFDQNDPAIEAIRERAREARRAAAFRPDTRPSGPLVNAPQPPIRPDNGAIQTMVQGLDAAAEKAGDARTAVIEIGPAAQTAAQQMQSSFTASINAMTAEVDRLQQKLNSLRAPSLSFGGGGLNTGRVLPEVQ
jgi:TP901 family phage tail tape measure protein